MVSMRLGFLGTKEILQPHRRLLSIHEQSQPATMLGTRVRKGCHVRRARVSTLLYKGKAYRTARGLGLALSCSCVMQRIFVFDICVCTTIGLVTSLRPSFATGYPHRLCDCG